MKASVRQELELLFAFARGVGESARQFPDRVDIESGGRGYIGGALTTMHHLGLLTDAEHREWWDRLMDELPPTEWANAPSDLG
jgi:hypothetical protein